MRHILVPTDFSECAEDALKVAVKLARMSGAVLHVAHVYFNVQPTYAYGIEEDDGSINERMRDSIQVQLDLLLENTDIEGVELHKHCIMNKPLWDVLELESMQSIDIVVMGSHGTSGVREFFLGSNAQKLVQAAECPVLVVKEYFDPGKVNNVLFVSNFYPEAIENFAPIRMLVDLMGARTYLLKVITPGSFEETPFSESSMKEFAKEAGLDDCEMATFNSKSIEKGIHAYIERIGADLVCIETHGRSGLGHWLAGSLAERVVNHADVPVLTMKIEGPILD